MIDVNKFTNMQLLSYTRINATDKFIIISFLNIVIQQQL